MKYGFLPQCVSQCMKTTPKMSHFSKWIFSFQENTSQDWAPTQPRPQPQHFLDPWSYYSSRPFFPNEKRPLVLDNLQKHSLWFQEQDETFLWNITKAPLLKSTEWTETFIKDSKGLGRKPKKKKEKTKKCMRTKKKQKLKILRNSSF